MFEILLVEDNASDAEMPSLAIAKKTIENLGGKVWVESETDKVKTFYFTLLKSN